MPAASGTRSITPPPQSTRTVWAWVGSPAVKLPLSVKVEPSLAVVAVAVRSTVDGGASSTVTSVVWLLDRPSVSVAVTTIL